MRYIVSVQSKSGHVSTFSEPVEEKEYPALRELLCTAPGVMSVVAVPNIETRILDAVKRVIEAQKTKKQTVGEFMDEIGLDKIEGISTISMDEMEDF